MKDLLKNKYVIAIGIALILIAGYFYYKKSQVAEITDNMFPLKGGTTNEAVRRLQIYLANKFKGGKLDANTVLGYLDDATESDIDDFIKNKDKSYTVDKDTFYKLGIDKYTDSSSVSGTGKIDLSASAVWNGYNKQQKL